MLLPAKKAHSFQAASSRVTAIAENVTWRTNFPWFRL